MASRAWKATVATVLALTWAAWIVALASLSRAQDKCIDPVNTDTPTYQLSQLNGFSRVGCSNIFRFWWFIVWFTFAALLVFSIFMAFPSLLQRSAFSWLAIWTILDLLWILMSDAWLTTQNTDYFTQGGAQAYARGVVAGSIMLATLCLLLAILMGWRQKRRDAAGVGPVKY